MKTHFEALPPAVALLVAALLVIGAGLTLIGAVGLLRLPTFYERIHAPTLGTSGGTAGIVTASMVLFSVLAGRLAVHELLIGFFVTITTPVTLMLLGRAALYRDRSEAKAEADRAAREAE
ncbi:monovalent cation/H(+) antiporter subunit G [Amaricoccus solimangrovi]|uniref:Cation:proton antiporter n=1 Tax=Amaricoccus solimangrovi TaxID=2589815 RepID=A0A501WIA8_9RHOB|nr:monovalent cation/H(+) antiporter subunit G [Amaricoccus solimangrovi]TPE49249.1 cation:proton antiporter [Amaricoccus solimangrovi]